MGPESGLSKKQVFSPSLLKKKLKKVFWIHFLRGGNKSRTANNGASLVWEFLEISVLCFPVVEVLIYVIVSAFTYYSLVNKL